MIQNAGISTRPKNDRLSVFYCYSGIIYQYKHKTLVNACFKPLKRNGIKCCISDHAKTFIYRSVIDYTLINRSGQVVVNIMYYYVLDGTLMYRTSTNRSVVQLGGSPAKDRRSASVLRLSAFCEKSQFCDVLRPLVLDSGKKKTAFCGGLLPFCDVQKVFPVSRSVMTIFRSHPNASAILTISSSDHELILHLRDILTRCVPIRFATSSIDRPCLLAMILILSEKFKSISKTILSVRIITQLPNRMQAKIIYIKMYRKNAYLY